MCRMFAYVGGSNEDIAELYEALKEASKNDVIRVRYGKSREHRDGWGYVIHAANGVFHYRTGKAIFDDDHRLPRVEGKVHAIFHTRLATDKNKIGNIFSHPYVAAADDRMIWLAHNGKLNDDVNSDPSMVDSEYILKSVLDKGTKEGIEESKRATETALNVLTLEIKRSTKAASLKYINYYLNNDEKEYREKYYDLYLSKMRDGVAVFSSTLKEYGLKGAKKVRYGILEELE